MNEGRQPISKRRIVSEIFGTLFFMATLTAAVLFLSIVTARSGEYIGRIGSNPFCSDCTANPFAPINNPFNPNSPRNPFGPYGNEFSPHSPNNPFATDTPQIYGTADE